MDKAAAVDLFEQELTFTLKVIQSNPKIYCHWEYRRFILRNIIQDCPEDLKTKLKSILTKEFDLCKKLLLLDNRNFHCWNHRKWLSRIANLGFDDEDEFTRFLRNKDPGNYSALHYRTVILADRWKNVPLHIRISEILSGMS